MGKGEDVKEMLAEISGPNYSSNFLYLGHISGPKRFNFFGVSQVFVLPTYHNEGFPNVICEALSSGLPIISTGQAGIKDAIVDNVNGFLLDNFPPKSFEIAEKLEKLIINPLLVKKFSANNLHSSNKYSSKKVISDFSDIYKSI